MIKCFLSHSSKDKEYVREVASGLRRETRIFDEQTFEKGMSPAEEIINGLDDTSLFVLFLSDAALESEWVKHEIQLAKTKVDTGHIQRIYPIIIDNKIDYTDARIPLWMKNGFNIQPIKKTKVAIRKINARLREIAFKTHPTLKERQQIYVGRNDKTTNVEQRFDDFDKPTPIVFVASGLNSIGRKSFIKNALTKSTIVRESYEFPIIQMEQTDSIEDFILKIDDLGLSDIGEIRDLMTTPIDDKINIAVQLVEGIIDEKERILIEDKGAIIQPDSSIISWFINIIDRIKSHGHLTFCIASMFRGNKSFTNRNPEYYFEEIPELNVNERRGLLKRYAQFRGLELERDDLKFFSDLLSGYPEQVLFAVDTICDSSLYAAKKDAHAIREYANDKAKVIIESFHDDEEKLSFLYFLSKFEFISYEFLFSLVDENAFYPLTQIFINLSICEHLGVNNDYIRVNQVIQDYISRSKFGTSLEYDKVLKEHIKEFIAEYTDDNRDLSEYIFSIQEAIKSGQEIDNRILVPSYFVKTIKALYEKGGSANYKEAIRLANRVLDNSQYMHEGIIYHIMFMKCQSLARLHDKEFFNVVRHIKEPDSSFLHGFYFRITRQRTRAIESYKRVLAKRPNDNKAKSELVLLYLQNEEYNLALGLAKDVYEKQKNNPIHANNYFNCLIYKDIANIDVSVVEEILEKLKSNPAQRSQEIYCSAKAKALAKIDSKIDEAFSVIEQGILDFPDIKYPVLTLCDLSIQYKNLEKLKYAIERLEQTDSPKSQTYGSFIRYKAIYLTLINQDQEAIDLCRKELSELTSDELSQFYEKLKQYQHQR
ncbi:MULTISPECIES: toll/interleukin-1 receptor domain-containing protein [unclassified Aeromonas]|uniref:toll/interleukin-1 receptor domain-containing protein n=1 Tax=unclassified Aeromonas TaxID=257493 RepID=UPI0022E5DDDC|nr:MULTISPECIES: toll/interleukin-1 receptor domain-containing protein [unclassified Aeromonas]